MKTPKYEFKLEASCQIETSSVMVRGVSIKQTAGNTVVISLFSLDKQTQQLTEDGSVETADTVKLIRLRSLLDAVIKTMPKKR